MKTNKTIACVRREWQPPAEARAPPRRDRMVATGGAGAVGPRGDNVFDRDYQLVADYSNGGARFFVGLRGRL